MRAWLHQCRGIENTTKWRDLSTRISISPLLADISLQAEITSDSPCTKMKKWRFQQKIWIFFKAQIFNPHALESHSEHCGGFIGLKSRFSVAFLQSEMEFWHFGKNSNISKKCDFCEILAHMAKMSHIQKQ